MQLRLLRIKVLAEGLQDEKAKTAILEILHH